jgi:hypothetical protein
MFGGKNVGQLGRKTTGDRTASLLDSWAVGQLGSRTTGKCRRHVGQLSRAIGQLTRRTAEQKDS